MFKLKTEISILYVKLRQKTRKTEKTFFSGYCGRFKNFVGVCSRLKEDVAGITFQLMSNSDCTILKAALNEVITSLRKPLAPWAIFSPL